MNEELLKEKLKKIEALFSKTNFTGEKNAAKEAIKRIKDQLNEFSKKEQKTEFRFAIHNKFSRQLFTALCRRYGVKPYRHSRQHRTSIMVRETPSFVNNILFAEFKELDKVLTSYLDKLTTKIIKEEIHHDVSEAEDIQMIFQQPLMIS